MQILKFKCRIKKEVKFKITPHNANSQNKVEIVSDFDEIIIMFYLNGFNHQLKKEKFHQYL